MSTNPLAVRRLRTILDCILISLLILVAISNYMAVQARPEQQPPAGGVLIADPIPLSNPSSASDNSTLDHFLLDDTTLAAMIAAENAALTPLQYFVNLPVVIR